MKKALDINKQMQLLEKRGVVFDNKAKAEEILLDVGYYRLGFYAFPFEQTFPNILNRTHDYVAGTTFQSIYDLYLFDTQLRRLLLNALDRIEVNLRSRITYIVSNHYENSPTWFVDRSIMKSDFVANFRKKVYSTLLENPIIKRHHAKYINDRFAPAWKTLEFMTLGNLTALFQAIKDSEVKKKIAAEYGCSLKVFVNYLETIRVIRNKCAHGSCLYNMDLAKGIKSSPAGINETDRHNIKGVYYVIRYMLGIISQTRRSELNDNLKKLLGNPREDATNKIIETCTKFSM